MAHKAAGDPELVEQLAVGLAAIRVAVGVVGADRDDVEAIRSVRGRVALLGLRDRLAQPSVLDDRALAPAGVGGHDLLAREITLRGGLADELAVCGVYVDGAFVLAQPGHDHGKADARIQLVIPVVATVLPDTRCLNGLQLAMTQREPQAGTVLDTQGGFIGREALPRCEAADRAMRPLEVVMAHSHVDLGDQDRLGHRRVAEQPATNVSRAVLPGWHLRQRERTDRLVATLDLPVSMRRVRRHRLRSKPQQGGRLLHDIGDERLAVVVHQHHGLAAVRTARIGVDQDRIAQRLKHASELSRAETIQPITIRE